MTTNVKKYNVQSFKKKYIVQSFKKNTTSGFDQLENQNLLHNT